MSMDGQGSRRAPARRGSRKTTTKRPRAKKTTTARLAERLVAPVTVILTAGHRNRTNGGAPGEMARTPKFARAYRDALRAAGHTVFYVQEMDGGDPDTFAGTLTALTAKVRAIAAGVPGDRLVMLDLHLEEGDAPRGAFTIVPDDPTGRSDDLWKNNADAVRLGHLVADRIAARTGLALRMAKEPGVMSERQTGVGEDRKRLAMFGGTAALRARMTRLLVEHGNIVKDLAVIDDPQTPARCAAAVVDALAIHFAPQPLIA